MNIRRHGRRFRRRKIIAEGILLDNSCYTNYCCYAFLVNPGLNPVLKVDEQPPVAESPQLIREAMDNLRRVFQVIHDHSKLAKSTTGLTGPQLWALKVLAEHAPLRVTDLAARMYLHPSTVVGILDRLEVKCLVERRRSNSDRRVVHVDLTAAGKAFVLRVPAVAQGALLAGLESLNRSELQTVARGLRLQVKILGAQELPPQLLLSPEVNAPECETAVRNTGPHPRVLPPASATPGRGLGKESPRRAGGAT